MSPEGSRSSASFFSLAQRPLWGAALVVLVALVRWKRWDRRLWRGGLGLGGAGAAGRGSEGSLARLGVSEEVDLEGEMGIRAGKQWGEDGILGGGNGGK